MNTLLAIVGPTASGKTRLGLLLAQRLGGEIVSADSRQVYRYLDVGTAKPTREERSRTPHHFIDILDPQEEYNAGLYGNQARSIIEGLLRENKIPVLVGGSGLYVRSVVDGLFEGPGRDPELRTRLEDRLEHEGIKGLMATLEAVDPTSAVEMIREPKPRRVIRALEVYYATGKPLSEFHRRQETNAKFRVLQVAVRWERRDLYERIGKRVDDMINQGLVEEVRWLGQHGYGPSMNSLNTVGYKEVFQYVGGKLAEDEAVELIKRNTRRFAKRQLTWFAADKRIKWISPRESFDAMADRVERLYGKAAG